MSEAKSEKARIRVLDGNSLHQTDERLHYAVVRTKSSIVGTSVSVVQTDSEQVAVQEAMDELKRNGGQPVVIFKAVRVVRPGKPIVSEVYQEQA